MNRAILETCLPCLWAIIAASAVFVGLARASGGRWEPRRLVRLHHCQTGAVQSLAFVLTLPLLLMVLLFVVQMSQLMVGLMTVNYAAYAAARAATVWTAAMVDDAYANLGGDADGDDQNELPPGIVAGVPFVLSAEIASDYASRKFNKIWGAAALACAPIAPSRANADVSLGASYAARATSAMQQLYPQFDPRAQGNSQIATRIANKLGYSYANTYVTLQFDELDAAPVDGHVTYNPIGHPVVPYYASEVGWQDPLTVTVYHDYALLPGIGPLLARVLSRYNASVTGVAPAMRTTKGLSKARLKASATMTVEGIKSLRPYVYPVNP